MVSIEQFFQPFPEIELGKILLRGIKSEDAENYYNYMSRIEMRNFLTQGNIPSSVEKAVEEVDYWKSLFTTKKSIYWAISLKNTGEMIGTAGFNVIYFSYSRAEISYDLSPDYWGKGIMFKTIKAILKFAALNLGLIRIQATVITDNDRSIKLLQRCGFQEEGLLKKYEFVNGQYKDYFIYSRVMI